MSMTPLEFIPRPRACGSICEPGPRPQGQDVWYRAYARVTLNRRETLDHATVEFDVFPVIRHTPKGVWLDISEWGYWDRDFQPERFVLSSARRRFACPTPEEAVQSLQARTARRIKHLETSLRRARVTLEWLGERHGQARDAQQETR